MGTEILDRRTAAAERMARVAQLNESVAVQIRDLEFDGKTIQQLDPRGTLCSSVQHVISLATRTAGFDLTLTAGEQGSWGVRVRNHGDAIEISAVAPCKPVERTITLERTAPRHRALTIPNSVVSELADLLRTS